MSRKFINILISRFKRRSYALNGLDIKLCQYLKIKNGIFIEAGANDGISQSNTLYFEKYYGWRGILIEPIPALAARCKKNRPSSIVENVALVPFDYDQDYLEMRYCDLMSVVKGSMKSEEEELEHIKKGSDMQDVITYDIVVPVATLDSIIRKHRIDRIDLLSLDVEGYELQVLKGIDFDSYQPEWILVEVRYRTEIDAFLSPMYDMKAKLSHHDVLYKLEI